MIQVLILVKELFSNNLIKPQNKIKNQKSKVKTKVKTQNSKVKNED